jgi:hypothetical protein
MWKETKYVRRCTRLLFLKCCIARAEKSHTTSNCSALIIIFCCCLLHGRLSSYCFRIIKQSQTMSSMIPNSEDCKIRMRDLAKPSEKRVQFAPVVSMSSAGPLVFEDVEAIWYNRTDLAAFKDQARNLASTLKSGSPQSCDLLRGLECSSVERQMYRCMTIRYIVSAYRKGLGTDQTAMIARKCTAWSEEIAFLQAYYDNCSVYQPSIASCSIPEVRSSPPEFVLTRKREVAPDSAEPQRLVRRRQHTLLL